MDQINYEDLLSQGRLKRIFRAKQKLTQPNLVSHITQRATGKEPLFIEDTDYIFMLSRIKNVVEKRSLEIYSFCLMPNHVHLLVSPKHDDLSEAMRDLFSGVAMKFNKKYARKGHLFGGPYRQAVCLEDTYLLAASLYIHLNPVRAGLVDDPRKYRWSSINAFKDGKAPRSFIKENFVLRLLGNNRHEQIRAYGELLMRGISVKLENVLEQEYAVRSFRGMLINAFPRLFHRNGKLPEESVFLDEEALGAKIKDVKEGKIGTKPETMAARRFLIEQFIARGYGRESIADRLGMSVKTVYNTLRSAN